MTIPVLIFIMSSKNKKEIMGYKGILIGVASSRALLPLSFHGFCTCIQGLCFKAQTELLDLARRKKDNTLLMCKYMPGTL